MLPDKESNVVELGGATSIRKTFSAMEEMIQRELLVENRDSGFGRVLSPRHTGDELEQL
jgi:hypothetical protein